MARTSMSVTKYLLHCQAGDERLIRLLSHQTEYQGRYKGMNSAIASTWLISFPQIQRDKPLAAEILRGICFFVEKDIPYSLCLEGENELEFDEAIGVLKAYAFVSEREDGVSFDIHRLVQLAMRNWLREEKEQERWMKQTIQRLSKRCPAPTYANKNLWQGYLPHILSAIQFYETKIGGILDMKILLNVAKFCHIIGNFAEEEVICRRSLRRGNIQQESNSEVRLEIMHHLGVALVDQGMYIDGRQVIGETLHQSKALLGEEHRLTFLSTIRFAQALNFCGEPVKAEETLRDGLGRCEALFGKSDEYTLLCMRRLGELLHSQKRYEESEKIVREVLKRLGSASSNNSSSSRMGLAAALSLLGGSLRGQGQFEEAEKVSREVINQYEKVVGERHPDTQNATLNLARVFCDQEKYHEAAQLYRNQIPLLRKEHGDEHQRTLGAISGLATTLAELKEYEESERLIREGLRLSTKVCGERHMDTLGARYNLIWVLKMQDKDEGASQVYAEMDADTRTAYDLQFPRSSST